jgi:hypothetical protein
MGYIYWTMIWSGDDKMARASGSCILFRDADSLVPGRLLMSVINTYLILFTNRKSTGLFIILLVDVLVQFAWDLGLVSKVPNGKK